MTEKTHHVSDLKKKIVKDIEKLIVEYPIIGAVNMENLPAPQLQQMRSNLRGTVVLTMTKRRLIKIAIESVKGKKKGIEALIPYLRGMPALVFTKENPFKLAKTLNKNKTSAPAKGGQTAPFDIKVPKGPTSFAPGPIIGELAMIGIKSGVESGKVAIKEDSIVVKEGQKISQKVAEILTRLGIEPMEVGLNLTAIYENGTIFESKVLNVDEKKFMEDLTKAASYAFNLAVNSGYPTKETIMVLIGKAFNDAKALGLSQNIIDDMIIDELLGKAERSALSLKSTANIEIPEKPKEEKPAKAEGEPKDEAKEPKEKIIITEKKHEAPEKELKREIKEDKKIIEKLEKVEEKKEEKIEKFKKEEEKIEAKIEKKEEVEVKIEKQVDKIKKEEEKLEKKEEKIEAKIEEEEIAIKHIEGEKKKLEEDKKIKEEELKAAKEIKKEVLDETDKKIAEMVEKTRKFVKGEIPTAENLIEEAGKLTAAELKQSVDKKPFEPIQKKQVRKTEKTETQQDVVEKLTEQLLRKGTLRK